MNLSDIISAENINPLNKQIGVDLWLNFTVSLEPNCLGITLN